MSRWHRIAMTIFIIGGMAIGIAGVLAPTDFSGDVLMPAIVVWLAIGGGGLVLYEVWTLK
jgi:hypothetical protein